MKRESAEMSFPEVQDQDGSSQCPHSPKRAPQPDRILKIWVEDLPLEAGCTSAAVNVAASGMVDDLKSAITARFSHPRFALYKKQFHKQYFEKLSTLNSDVPLKFQWSEYSTYSSRPPLEYRP